MDDFPGRLVFCTHSWEGFEDRTKRDAQVYRHGGARTDLYCVGVQFVTTTLPEADPREEYGEDYDSNGDELYSEFRPEMLATGRHGEVDLGVVCRVDGPKKVYYWITVHRLTSYVHEEPEPLLRVDITRKEKAIRRRPRVTDLTLDVGTCMGLLALG